MSEIKVISTENAPAAIGPYVQGKIVGGLLFASGQIPLNPKTGSMVEGGIEEQARQALNNVKALVEAAGSDLSKVVKTTCFLKDIADFAAFNSVYAEFFNAPAPARSCVGGIDLPKGALCEIEVIASV
ncbi:MAG: RidA family protein [Succinivibrio sp.]